MTSLLGSVSLDSSSPSALSFTLISAFYAIIVVLIKDISHLPDRAFEMAIQAPTSRLSSKVSIEQPYCPFFLVTYVDVFSVAFSFPLFFYK